MRSTAPMRTAKIGCIAISCAMCFLGLLMLLFPNPSSALIGAVCGVLLILFGCVRLIGYFSKDLYRLAFQFDLTIGVVAVVLGVALLARPGPLCRSRAIYPDRRAAENTRRSRIQAVRHPKLVADPVLCRLFVGLRPFADAPPGRGRSLPDHSDRRDAAVRRAFKRQRDADRRENHQAPAAGRNRGDGVQGVIIKIFPLNLPPSGEGGTAAGRDG